MHRIPFEIVTKPCFAHVGLLASLLGKKVSANPWAIQCLENGAINKEIVTRLAVAEDTIRFYLKKHLRQAGCGQLHTRRATGAPHSRSVLIWNW